jgi:hypothetical protein
MKIPIQYEPAKRLKALPVSIKDLSSGLEGITIRVLRYLPAEKPDALLAEKPEGKTVADSVSAVRLLAVHIKSLYGSARIELASIPLRILLGVGAGLIVAALVLAAFQLDQSHPNHGNVPSAAAHTAQDLPRGAPSFATLLPVGKTVRTLGGWAKVSPPGRDPAYAYVDMIGSVQIQVSEQPLPANFRADTAHQIEQLAQSFDATDKLMAGTVPVYVGTSAKGPQSVILAKHNLLILIKSAALVPDNKWVAYVNLLQ